MSVWQEARLRYFCMKTRLTTTTTTVLLSFIGRCAVQPLSIDCGGDDVDAYVVVYSVTDRPSFAYAQSCLADLKRRRKTLPRTSATSAVVLVANKQDLVRNRVVSESGRTIASTLLFTARTRRSQHSQECKNPRRHCDMCLVTLTFDLWPQNKWGFRINGGN